MNLICKRLKYLFPIIVVLMIGGLIISRIYRPSSTIPEPEIRIEAREAANYIGTAAEVCGEVASARFIPRIGGQPTFLNFGQPDPNQFFTVIIWGENRPKWETPPEELYQNKRICVTGRITEHEGTPQIVAENLRQIVIE